MPIDLNTAGPQRDFTPIAPAIYSVTIRVKPGSAGPDGSLTRSKDGACEMLVFDAIVDEGEHAKARIFERCVISGSTKGHHDAIDISFRRLRALVESAKGVRPDDQSPAAVAARSINSFADLNGLRCLARVGIEPERKNEKTGEVYQARNFIQEFITPDRVDWRQLPQTPSEFPGVTPTSKADEPTASVTTLTKRPDWAK